MFERRSPVLSFVLAGIVASCGVFAACSMPTSPSPTTTTTRPPTVSQPLTPARQLAGTWATDVSTTFYYNGDFCGQRQLLARAQWNVSWEVTPVSGFTNVVDVEMRNTRGSITNLSNCVGGTAPDISPRNFRLCISSTSITRCSDETYNNGYAFGSFTTDLMMLTWTHYECLIYCWGTYTESNELHLRRRS